MNKILTICLFLAIAGNLTAQDTAKSVDTVNYKHQTYNVHTGTKGGKFIILQDSSRHYIASSERVRSVSSPKDNGNGTAKYKDADYKIWVGSRGGRYIVYNGNKIYLK